MQECRWTLTVEFDSIQETINAEVYDGGLGEAAEFYQLVRKHAKDGWGFLNEEIDECVEMTGETVRVSLELIDPFEALLQYVTWHTSPKRVELVRNTPRGS